MPLYTPFAPVVGFAEQSGIPAAPTAGTQVEFADPMGRHWVRLSSGRLIYRGGRYAGGRQFALSAVNGSTTVTAMGVVSAEDGTTTAITAASTNYATRQPRLESLSAASAGANCGRRCTGTQYLSDAGFASASFCVEAFQPGMAFFAGLRPPGAHGNVDPSSFANCVGVGIDAGQTTLRLLNNDGSGTASAVDLGANFPANTSASDFYELMLWWNSSATTVLYQVLRINTGHLAQGSLVTDIPAVTQSLSLQVVGNTRAGTSAIGLSISQMGGESF